MVPDFHAGAEKKKITKITKIHLFWCGLLGSATKTQFFHAKGTQLVKES